MGPSRKVAYSKGMTRGLPPRVALLCALGTLAGSARRGYAEDRRPVAIVDLTGDDAAKALGTAIYDQLQSHWALRSLGDPSLDAVLEGALLDEDAPGLQKAHDRQAAALDALTQFQDDAAADDAKSGEQALASVTPTAAVSLLSDLAFSYGLAELGLHHPNEANQAFALVYRLDPMRQVDPARYEPAVVEAFRSAKETSLAHCKLTVHGAGRVWIDGVEVGEAPGVFETQVGQHLVQITAPDRATAGVTVALEADGEVVIAPPPADKLLAISRARLALAHAPDDAIARAGPMKHLAELLGVHDAVLIWKRGDGALSTQTWRDHAPGFSAPRVHGDEPPRAVLAPLAPPEPPVTHLAVPVPLPPVPGPEPAWYQRRWVQVSVAAGVIAGVVGAVLWASRPQYVPVNGMSIDIKAL
jgi:hypothetical protein